jgi:enamine deaminase RidA (YjgF/YER057c/UK114 family)
MAERGGITMNYRSLGFVLLMSVTGVVSAADTYPMKVPAPGGEVIHPDAAARQAHDEFRYAAARRVDNMLYVSGVIVNRRKDEAKDVAAFKLQARRALDRLKQILAASGTSFENVVMINSFHVWQGPNFDGTRDEQFNAFEEVIDDYTKPPYPAWTAVGTTGLLSDGGIIEVQLIARVPDASK